jgi:hypothetical protein
MQLFLKSLKRKHICGKAEDFLTGCRIQGFPALTDGVLVAFAVAQ